MTPTAAARRRTQPAPTPTGPTESLTGRVEKVLFSNPETGYTVLKVTPEVGEANLAPSTAVGSMGRVREGDRYKFTGSWTEHSKFGRQFQFTAAELLMPTGRQGIVRYLSDIVYGIGPTKAGRIVEALGDNALEKMTADPSCLDGLSFLSPEQRSDLTTHLVQNRVVADLAAMICREGITPNLAQRIYARFGADSVQTVKENPYVLADEVWGVGFVTADKVARSVGIEYDNPNRVRAAVEYVIKEAAEADGHCYLRPRDILPATKAVLGPGGRVDVPELKAATEALTEQGRLIREDNRIYTARLYGAEIRVAERLRSLIGPMTAAADVSEIVGRTEERLGIEYAVKQRTAVQAALENHLSVITGGPGTGKTTVTKAIVLAYKEIEPDRPIYLASPTGRAAKRLSEATGQDAQTIHRLLAFHPEVGFRFNEDNPLEPGLLIVDEMSMTDVELAADLFCAVTPQMQVVLVGDADQLPSVGPGSVLRDIILSCAVPVTRLDFVYRQAAGSEIHLWAHLVREGNMPALKSGEDVTVIEVADIDQTAPRVVELAKEAAARYGVMGFQVLAPMKKGSSGVTALNEAVQEALNPRPDGSKTRFAPGDKVLVVKNSYKLGVYNGDLGQVIHTGPGLVVARFGDQDDPNSVEVDFAEENRGLLQLAYASTIHKSQGSEFPLVIVALTRGHWIMLQRNLLYTAITRAKRHLVVVCQADAVRRAVVNSRIDERLSWLAVRLRGGVEMAETAETAEEQAAGQ